MANLIILQWNAQGMMGHGEELKKWIYSRKNNPVHLICIQETWYEDNNIIQIPNYKALIKNRDGFRGGCAFYIHDSIAFDYPPQENLSKLEAQLIKVYHGKESIYVVNYYNPWMQKD